ncbi:acyl-CoA dehydrogenase family protein [Nocardia pseudovaccinii]|uniref:acyl-CoA dehydrogenase family protein n=1 Tax=Nocardia pseudovaccinii TaxID=189540 RepID=UPI003D8C0CF6
MGVVEARQTQLVHWECVKLEFNICGHDASAENTACALADLRAEVRAFVHQAKIHGEFVAMPNSHTAVSGEMSRRLADRGWAGTAIPAEFGGRPRSVQEQWVIAEELLAGGVPLGGHWICDRQVGRNFLTFASRSLQERFLPAMARGELTFALGMSEPGSGSDLASIRTRASRAEGGWRISGQKVWTTRAHQADYSLVLCRTDPAADKGEALSQFVVDLGSPGVEIRRIPSSDGMDEYCEVFFDDVLVPDENLVGEAGSGWKQITAELSYERAWPDRYLSTLSVVEAFRESLVDDPDTAATGALGSLITRLASIRGLSWNAVELAAAGSSASSTAALAKDAGTTYEQSLLERIRGADHAGRRHRPGALRDTLRRGFAVSPMITVRGGTSEILRSVIGKQLRAPVFRPDETLLGPAVEELLKANVTLDSLRHWDKQTWAADLWVHLAELGFVEGIADPELSTIDVCEVLRLIGYHAAPVPLAESAFLAPSLLGHAGLEVPDGILTVAPVRAGEHLRVRADGTLSGVAAGVPYASASEHLVVLAHDAAGMSVGIVPTSACTIAKADPIWSVWGEDVDLTGATFTSRATVDANTAQTLWCSGALARAVQMVGAMERAVDLAVEYSGEREQFGRAIRSFQAVRDHLTVAAREVALARAAVRLAIAAVNRAGGVGNASAATAAVAMAKGMASEASLEVSRRTHQVHGAIGTTREYPLHFVTAQLAAWRDQFGDENQWYELIGSQALADDSVWSYVTEFEVAS